MPKATPVLFCAPTIQQARREAWNFVREHGQNTLLDPPLVLCSPLAFAAWRALVSDKTKVATGLPRLSAPELFFARAHGANSRSNWLGGVERLWALSGVLRRLENNFSHIDFDADDTEALRAMAGVIAAMRRHNLTSLPVGDDGFGRELDQWRAGYDRILEEQNAFDFEAAPALFVGSVKRNRAFAFPPTLLVDDLLELSPALELGLGTLVGRAGCVVATLALPNGWNDDVAARARAFWTRQGAKFHFVRGEETAPTSRLRVSRALLSEHSDASELPEDVSLTRAHTPWDESERVAAHIRARLDAGDAPRDFCLVLPSPAVQAPLVRAAFEAHRVPLGGREREMDGSPLVERVLRLLVQRPSWSVDALHDVFGDGALRLEWEGENGETRHFDAGRLRRAHRSVRGERDDMAWRDPVALARDWEARIVRLRDASSGQGDEARATSLARSLDGGDLEGVTRLKALLLPFQEPLSPSEWADAALGLCDALTDHWLVAEEDGGEVSARARKTLNHLRKSIEELRRRAGEEGGARSSNRWAAWLRLELANESLDEEENEARIEGVRVLNAHHAGEAGSEGEQEIFVLGLTERAWPAPPALSPWPATTAKTLETLRAGEPAPIARALHGLARLMATNTKLHLSHPSWLNGSETEASPLVEDLRALFPGTTWPELASADSYVTPTSRAQWLRRSSQSTVNKADGEFQVRLSALREMQSGRASVEQLGRYDGVLDERGRELLAPLLPRAGERLELSSSGAELYARCGLHFFFDRVLQLPDETQTEDDLSRAESGDLVHRILHAFRREWKQPLSSANFEEAKAALENHVRRECERLGLPPILRRAEARRLLGTPKRDGALVRLLRAECNENDSRLGADVRGVFAETLHPLVHLQSGAVEGSSAQDWQLGERGNGLEQPFRLPLDGVLVKGRIDRMDAAQDGSWLLVLDYKTGSAASLPSFTKGSERLHFQLAIYLLAARHLTREWASSPRVAAAYLSPRVGYAGVVAAPDLLAPEAKGAMEEGVQAKWLGDTRAQIEKIATLIEAGTFNLSLRTAKVARCEWCAHQMMCNQKAAVQAARAEIHTDSNVLFFPSPIEWNGEEN